MADFNLDAVFEIVGEVTAERQRQHAKWGEQNLPDGTHPIWAAHRDIAQAHCARATERGGLTYADLLREEVFEACAETDPAKLREELVQVAAVAVQWIEAIDRRAKAARAEVPRGA